MKHPRVDCVHYQFHGESLHPSYEARDVCGDGVSKFFATWEEVDAFATEVSAAQARIPVGEFIYKVTKAVGIRPCSSCEERRQRINMMLGVKK